MSTALATLATQIQSTHTAYEASLRKSDALFLEVGELLRPAPALASGPSTGATDSASVTPAIAAEEEKG